MEIIVFKRWSNKKYAILASFHKVIIICSLSLSYNLAAQNRGQEKSDSSLNENHYILEEVESIAEEVPDIYAPSLRPLIILSQKEIISSPASGFDDILEYVHQIDIRKRGKHGVQADLSFQGGTFDQSMVLFNGINITDPQTGHFNLNIPVANSAIRSTELLIGPATKTYGTNAYNGAVNIITSPGDSTLLGGGLRFGQYGYLNAFANLNLASENIRSLFHFNTASGNGYTENTDFRSLNGFVHTTWQTKQVASEVMAGWTGKKFGANSFYTPYFPDQYEETATGITALKLRTLTLKPDVTFNLYWRQNIDHFILDRDDPGFYENFHRTNTFGSDLKGSLSTRAGISVIGIITRVEHIASTALGYETENGKKIPGQPESYTHAFQRNHISIVMDQKMYIGGLSVSAGALVHMNDHNNYKPSLFPGLDLGYDLSDHHRIYLAYNRSMRLPTFTDLFYSGPANVGNPDLKPEHANTFQAGVQSSLYIFRGSVNGFYRKGKDIIDWIRMDDDRWHTMNITELNTFGTDMNITAYPDLIRQGPGVINHARIAYQFTTQQKVSEDYISHYAMDHLRHKMIFDIDHRIIRSLFMNWKIIYQDRHGEYPQYDPVAQSSEVIPFDPFWIIDLKIRYEWRRLSSYLEASNLLNNDYVDIGNVTQPGRWVIGGIEIR